MVVEVAGIFDKTAHDGFKRLWGRCGLAKIDFWQLLWRGTATDWEMCMTKSFKAGASIHLEESTIIQQLVQEFKVAMCVGRKLIFGTGSADVEVSIRRTIQCRDTSGSVFDLEVDLLWPGEARSVVRMTEAWWDAKGGKPRTQEAKLAHAAAKASSRAMPTRFHTNLLMLCFWQERLLSALVEIDRQMLANKAAGNTKWHHPSSLCSGRRYANGSAFLRAVHSARGMLACAWHIATGGRQAEAFRWRATDSNIAGVSPDINPPVWCLGLAGSDVLTAFQQADGTGFGMINWHAKGIYDYGSPDYVPIWPPGMSGICLGNIINFAFQVLTFLQPTSPTNPILQHNPDKAIYQPSSTAAPRQTLNNARGYMFPYGELKHLPALGDPVAPPVAASDMGGIVNNAIGSAAFLGSCWTGVQAAGTSAPPGAAAVKYNNPSMYSMRYTHAGEVMAMLLQLGINILPTDIWAWYLQYAGRSELSNSYATYVKGYEGTYEARLPYIRESTNSWLVVDFRQSMLSWSPRKPNEDVSSRLTEAQQASMKRAVELAQQYAANPSTEAIWLHLIGLVEQEGSFAGMLRRVCGPLLHQSYELPAFLPGPDLAWLRMTPAQAQAHMARLLASINAANVALFGPLPDPPTKRVLLQNTVDLLCCDVDRIKLALASPQARANAADPTAHGAHIEAEAHFL